MEQKGILIVNLIHVSSDHSIPINRNLAVSFKKSPFVCHAGFNRRFVSGFHKRSDRA